MLVSLVATFLLSVHGLLQVRRLCCEEHRPDLDVNNMSLGILLLLAVSLANSTGHSLVLMGFLVLVHTNLHPCFDYANIIVIMMYICSCLRTQILLVYLVYLCISSYVLFL